MLAAGHFFTLDGRRYTPGEVIDQKIDPETLEWLESTGAIVRIGEDDGEAGIPAGTERKAKKPAPAHAAEEGEAAAISPDMDMTDAIVTKKRRKR